MTFVGLLRHTRPDLIMAHGRDMRQLRNNHRNRKTGKISKRPFKGKGEH